MPRVSVIIIFLNGERFIQEAIESVFAQTFSEWELLLVDDGSSDSSTKIARHYAERFPDKVTFHEHEGHQNRGMSASRNLGIRKSQSDYVAFLDSDDAWLPTKLAEQVAILDSHPDVGMVYGPGRWWYSWSGNAEDVDRDFVQNLRTTPNTVLRPPELLRLFLHNEGAVPSPSGVMVRRGPLEQIGGFEEELCNAVRGLYDDQGMYSKMALVAPVFVSDNCWYRYRQQPDSCCSVMGQPERHAKARFIFLEWLKNHPLMQAQTDSALRKVFAEQYRIYQPPHAMYRAGRMILRTTKTAVKWIGATTLPSPLYESVKARWQRVRHANN